MEYLLLIYSTEGVGPQPGTPEFQDMLAGYGSAGQKMTERGVMRGGNALQDVNTATCVAVRDGKPTITDGPFAETKEQLGGYYLVDCKNLDEALEMAELIPGAQYGRIEVRPIQNF